MITPSQCRKIVDDILFDSFGFYQYVFLDPPEIVSDEYSFEYAGVFGKETEFRLYRFDAQRREENLFVTIKSYHVSLEFNIYFTDSKLKRVAISSQYSPDFKEYTEEYSADYGDLIQLVVQRICNKISNRDLIN